MITIRDLLTQQKWIGSWRWRFNDLAWRSNFVQDIQNLQYLKPVSAFRTQYDYDNLLYIVAGEVIREASGLNWCGFCRRTHDETLRNKSYAASYV
jgi:CubicO group peptidase (beta-lactamase class C family)